MVANLWSENARLKKQVANQRNRRRPNPNRNMRRGNNEGEKKGDGEMRRRGGDQRGGNQRGDNKAKKPLPGKHPTDDPTLMGLLRRSIRVETKKEIDDLFAEIDKEIGDDADRGKAMAQGFIRIISATAYGTDEGRARSIAFCAKNGHPKVFDKKAADAKKKEGATDRGTKRRRERKEV
jgi:hypothetical protein